ncbi:glycosyl transferase family 90 [Aquibaculum arenosum]|uniref:Glycosyl transferase family 90 n=1 Tax=Aquibaculum arenosum TaxID=3032591 RepID=A0ABT5YN05_9PROT|nr:glycosyl transferase family 90 [Fodinicurvata sp. CAU 1616]MDF2096145.1 glycosyl transferase family 90 [Fodinicurvata sp. CAU 1616]
MDQRDHALPNCERLRHYFDAGLDASAPTSLYSQLSRDPCMDSPFLFSRDSFHLTDLPEPKRKLAANYASDMIYFLDVVDPCATVAVQFGDHELKRRTAGGLIFKKARAIGGAGIILKLNTRRHWNFRVDLDTLSWGSKETRVVWRGATTGLAASTDPTRLDFVKRYHGRFDVCFSALTPQADASCARYLGEKLGIRRQLRCKYVVSLPGNDVATNLKWILASNSVPIMPLPKKDSWLLESQLVPFEHFVPLREDLGDLDDIFAWCAENDRICREISENGRRYMQMFFDRANEEKLFGEIYRRYCLAIEHPEAE